MKASRVVAVLAASAAAAGLAPAIAQANSGHFIENGANAPVCTDVGTQVSCDGKVAGLGGTTFEITVDADGIASVECENEGGNVAPGQDTAVSVEGGTGELPTPTNGQYIFTDLRTADPAPLNPSPPTCPDASGQGHWTANIVDVAFTTATLSLFEDGVLVDQIDVAVG